MGQAGLGLRLVGPSPLAQLRFAGMFRGAKKFSRSLAGWNVSSVEDMSAMLRLDPGRRAAR
jgi:hypothetical protein